MMDLALTGAESLVNILDGDVALKLFASETKTDAGREREGQLH